MTEQELNKKLAEWRGFTPSSDPDKPWTMWSLWGEADSGTLIQPLIGRGQLGKGLNFTQDETACFKWLVPKLRDLSEDNTLQDIEFHWQGKNISDVVECNLIFDEVQFDGEAETPALALCKAIEKLIDGEK